MTTSPSTDNYTLGKGVVFFDRIDPATGLYTGERDLGNAPTFEYTVALSKLDHYSSRGGLKTKDAQVISEITPGCAFSLDECTKENIALLTLGNLTKVTQTSGSVPAEIRTAHLGMRLSLANRGVSSVVVKDAATGLITYVAGVDYLIDTALNDDKIGRILILPGGTITEAESLTIAYTKAATTYYTIDSFANTRTEGRLRFVSANPIGNNMELQIWRVSLTPNGNTAMIGDQWSTLGFTGEILKDAVNHPTTPFMQFIMS